MNYTITRTEANVPTAEEYETRTMMYLMNTKHSRNNELSLFFIDAFNDVTGVCSQCKYVVDAQAKGYKKFPPSTIGKSLITLFLNHNSSLDFSRYILLCKHIEDKYLVNVGTEELTCYQLSDFTVTIREKIVESLKKEYEKLEGANSFTELSTDSLQEFYNNTYIVVDKSEKGYHIKNMIPLNKLNEMNNDKLAKIFDEITDKRVSLKKINIENVKVNKISDCKQYNKYIMRKTLESLVVSRVIGYDIFKRDIPLLFLDYIKNLDREEVKDTVLSANSEISKAIFDVNNSDVFFQYLDAILKIVDDSQNVEDVYNKLLVNDITIPSTLSEISSKYLISMIIGGIYED